MHAWITGGQEFGIENCFLSPEADDIDTLSSDSLTATVEPLDSLSSGFVGLTGVAGLLIALLCVAIIGELGLESNGGLDCDAVGEGIIGVDSSYMTSIKIGE